MRGLFSLILVSLLVPSLGLAAPRSPKRIALLVGIGDYPHFRKLRGPANDVKNMSALLVERFGFARDDVKILRDEQADRDGILRALETHLVRRADKDTDVLFYYSGHGSQSPRPRRGASASEHDGMDETIVPYDSGRGGRENRDIPDDTIRAVLSGLSLRARSVTFIVDSCHSGTIDRDGSVRTRSVVAGDRPPRDSGASIDTFAATATRTAENPRYTVISAAADRELAHERFYGHQVQGSLTWHLTRVLRELPPDATGREVFDLVKEHVTADFPDQHPQINGAAQDDILFSGVRGAGSRRVSIFARGGRRAVLLTGIVHGATKGSVYEVFTRGSTAAAAIATITAVDLTSSSAELDRDIELSAGARARELRHVYEPRAAALFIQDRDRPEYRELLEALSRKKSIRLSADRSESALFLELSADRELFILRTGGSDEHRSTIPVAAANSRSELLAHIERWARWYNLRALTNGNTELDLALELIPKEPAPAGQLEQTVASGTKLTVHATNKSRRSLYLTLINFSSDGSIQRISPRSGEQNDPVPPGATRKWAIVPRLQGDQRSSTELLRMIGTFEPVDLSHVEVEAAPGSAVKEIEALYGKGQQRVIVKNDGWVTTDRAFHVVPEVAR